MSEPFDLTSLAAGIAVNFVTAVLMYQGGKYQSSSLGRISGKIGLTSETAEAKVQQSLESAIRNYLSDKPASYVPILTNFCSDQRVVQAICDQVLTGTQIDEVKLVGIMADYFDMPITSSASTWPNGIDPKSLIRDLVQDLDQALATSASAGDLWLGRQIKSLHSPVEKISDDVASLRSSLPALFNDAAREVQSEDFKSLERDYLAHLKSKFGRITTLGARELHGVSQSLDVAYISLNVQAHGRAEPVRAEKFLQENPYITMRGLAGSGKTTLLSWIIIACADDKSGDSLWKGGVPFFVPLRKVARVETGPPRATKFLSYGVDNDIWTGSEGAEWVHEVLAVQKRGIIMIDGVDELPPSRREGFWEWLRKFSEEYPGNRIIVTSRTLPGTVGTDRPEKPEQWNPPPHFLDAELEEMSDDDIKEFVRQWHEAVDRSRLETFEQTALNKAREQLPAKLQDPANRRIRELCSTPLLCAMVCVLHWREEGYLPRARVDLYARCCDMLIEARDEKRDIQKPSGPLAYLTKDDKELVLQRLAFDMMRNKPEDDEEMNDTYRIEITREKALKWIQPRIISFQRPEARNCSPEELLSYLLERTGLLREPGGGLIDFVHRTFQEYLAACAAGAEWQEQFLAKQADDDQWHETIMLAAGTGTGGVSFGRALIQALLTRAQRNRSARAKSQQVRKTCFALSLGCLENLRQQDPDLRDAVLAHLEALVPPRSSSDARILAFAEDASVPYLKYEQWKDENTATVAACAQALRLIGTTRAHTAIENGYLQDMREAVAVEVYKTGVFSVTKLPYFVKYVLENGRLPNFVAIRNITALVGVHGLRSISLDTALPVDMDHVSTLQELEKVSLIDLSDNEAECVSSWPNSLKDIRLHARRSRGIQNKTCGQNLAWISRIINLERLDISVSPECLDTNSIARVTSLKSLDLRQVGLQDLSALGRLSGLEELVLFYSQDSMRFSFLCELLCLKSLLIIFCRDLQDLSFLERMSVLENLTIMHRPSNIDLSPVAKLARLKHLRIVSNTRETSLSFLTGINELQSLSLSEFSRVQTAVGISTLVCLQSLSISSFSSLRELPRFHKLQRLVDLEIINTNLVDEFTAIGEASNLQHLAICGCKSLSSLDWVSNLTQLKTLVIDQASHLSLSRDQELPTSISRLVLSKCGGMDDLSAVAKLVNLKHFVMSDLSLVRDVSFLKHLSNLEVVTILGTQPVLGLDIIGSQENISRIELSLEMYETMKLPSSVRAKIFVRPHRYWAGAQWIRRLAGDYSANDELEFGFMRPLGHESLV